DSVTSQKRFQDVRGGSFAELGCCEARIGGHCRMSLRTLGIDGASCNRVRVVALVYHQREEPGTKASQVDPESTPAAVLAAQVLPCRCPWQVAGTVRPCARARPPRPA